MVKLLLNSIALDPNRWTKDKIPYFRLERLLAAIADAGFRFIEVWQYHISEESGPGIERIRALADSLGLSMPVVGLYPQLHLTGDEHERHMANVKNLIGAAATLGAEVVKIFVGSRASALLSQAEYERSVGCVKELMSLASAHDLIVTGEMHQKTLLDTIESCERLIVDVGDKRFKICFQPFDLRDTEQALRDFDRVAKDALHVHYQGRREKKMELLENSDLDYRRLTQALAAHDFRGYICLEFTKDCVVERPEEFKLRTVLENARRDREFVLRIAQDVNMEIVA